MRAKRKRKMRRIKRERRRRHEKIVIAPSISSLPNDALEEVFLRLPIKSLIQLKSLSKQWRWTIESLYLAERQLKIAQSAHPKMVMVVSEETMYRGTPNWYNRTDTDIGFRTFCLESCSLLSFKIINFPIGFQCRVHISESCDGLFCIHSPTTKSMYVANPLTSWIQQLPPPRFQFSDKWDNLYHLAFVKATRDYKLVWLYNADISTTNTKCEVFDFRSNAWRYLDCTPSYRVFSNQKPAIANGRVYWFTEPYNDRIEVLAFDIHTETFSLLPNIISGIAGSDPRHINMCTLDNRLCMSRREDVTMIQEIWSLKPSQDTWEKIYTIDLISCPHPHIEKLAYDQFKWSDKNMIEPCTPVAVCNNNNKIWLSHCYSRGIVIYDLLSKSLDFVFAYPTGYRKVPYFPSLITHI